MSPNEALHSSNKPPARGFLYTVPSKSFVLGEYGVLSGLPALVATFGPRFGMRTSSRGGNSEFAARSPFGRLLELARARKWALGESGFKFDDPYGGEGGFGASTAQFALGYRILATEAGWELSAATVRGLYRELMADEPLPPSGADLFAQWLGGVVCMDPAQESKVDSRFSDLDWQNLLVFSAVGQPGRKVPTHQHLSLVAGNSVLSSAPLLELARILERGLTHSKDPVVLGQAMKDYAATLARAGLELAAARADREALSGLPGVLGCKGTGALLADGVLVLLEPGQSRRPWIIETAEARGLKLVADGLGTAPESGISENKIGSGA